jgi:hypothetical protein
VTIYTAASGAHVFAAGSMRWPWGLDDFEKRYYSISSTNAGVQQMTHNILRTFAARETAPVIFVNTDADNSGDWTNRYGSDGYWIAGNPSLTNIPAYVQVTITGAHVQVWTNQSTDPRALLQPPGFSNRIASAWTTTNIQGSSFTVDLNFTDSDEHQVALYCVDWLGTGTVLQKIEVFDYGDTSFAHPLDVRSFQLSGNGVYLVWKLKGHKIIRVTKPDATIINKALVSAIFFGNGS